MSRQDGQKQEQSKIQLPEITGNRFNQQRIGLTASMCS